VDDDAVVAGFSPQDKLQVVLLLVCIFPFVATVFLGFESGNAAVVALSTGLAIASAGFALAWGTESMQFMVSQVLALAVLALVQVAPEYSVEVVLAYSGATNPVIIHYATAAMTGANRLLLGLGWPAVFLLSWASSRREGRKGGELVLEEHQSVEVFFLGLATVYSFIIVARRVLGVGDAIVLLVIFGSYLYIAKRLPPHRMERVEELEGPSKAVASLKGSRRIAAMVCFVALGAVVIVFGSKPFVTSFLSVMGSLGLNQYLLIQWLTPVLTELPEATTVFYWAAKTGRGALALANLISSKLNQWTVLIATIPIVYCVALGGFSNIVLTAQQTEEILLTASQSLFGFVCLMDLKLTKFDAGALLTLFVIQLVLPQVRLEVAAAYLVLAAFEAVRERNDLQLLSSLSHLYRSNLKRSA
jgi:cation:H+ antiporter